MSKNALRLLSLFLIILTVSSCHLFSTLVLTVGDYEIYQKDIDYRNAVSRIYYPNDTDPEIGLIQLREAFMMAAVLNQNGVEIKEKDLLKEEARILFETRDEATLDKIRNIFGKDKEAYLKDFVLPTLVSRVIYYDFFLTNPQVQYQARKEAVQFYEKVKHKPETFKDYAQKNNIKYDIVSVTHQGREWSSEKKDPKKKAGGLIDMSSKSHKQTSVESSLRKDALKIEKEISNKWIQNYFVSSTPGSIVHDILDDHLFWLVLRYLNFDSKNKIYTAEVAKFPKLEFQQWFEREKLKVKVSGKK